MSDGEREKKERRGGAVWFGSSFEGGLRWFLTAPEAWLTRAAVSAGVALNLAGLAAILAAPSAPGPGEKLPLFGAKPAYDLRDALYSPRSMITGFKHILAPDFAASEGAPERRSDEGSAGTSSPEPGLGLELSSEKAKGEETGKSEEGAKDKDAAEAAAAAAAGQASARASGGLAGASGFGGGTRQAGGATTSAALAVGSAEGGDAASRDKQPIGVGRKGLARGQARSRAAMDQLKFAQNQSNRGRMANSSERSFQAADNAFQGQSAQPGGIPAVAAGASAPAAPPMAMQEGGPRNASPVMNCPAGTQLINGNACKPIETRNVTPYQGLVEMARKFLIAAAVLAVLGLFLLMKGGPGGQLLGGLLLGAAIALAVAAMMIGNTIEKEYGQAPQKKAIEHGASKSLGR